MYLTNDFYLGKAELLSSVLFIPPFSTSTSATTRRRGITITIWRFRMRWKGWLLLFFNR